MVVKYVLRRHLMINFLNLEYFLVAAEELNFTKAAKRLYISQQSLSNHISNLEKEFGTEYAGEKEAEASCTATAGS